MNDLKDSVDNSKEFSGRGEGYMEGVGARGGDIGLELGDVV